MSNTFAGRDLWWEARQHTAELQDEVGKPGLFKMISMSLPGKPVVQSLAAANLGRANAALAIDLNHYRPNRNLKAFRDAGVDIFILRIGGPTRWVDGNWGYKIDATYKPYLEQCDRIGVLGQTIGYIVHNPFESYTINGATGETIHTELIDDWTSGGYMPQAFCYDHEVATAWRSTGAEIKATNYNLVKSLEVNTDNTYKKFKRAVGIYTARWFTNANAPSEHTIYFDNVNKPESAGGPGKQRPMWWAWYPPTENTTYTNLQNALEKLLVPTPDQIMKLLQQGSYSLADLWQFTSALKLAGGMLDGSNDTAGVDGSVSLNSLTECLAAWGLKPIGTAPNEPPVEPLPTDWEEQAAALAGRLDLIEAALKKPIL